MPTIDIPAGTIEYRVTGPDDATTPPVVFVHGFLVNGELWSGVADRLGAQGVRCYQPNLPLGSHTIPLAADADRTPRGVAQMIIAFVERLGLEDVTLVGNDTGGALCQFVLDTDPSRVGRVVLTNCDAYDQFPPSPFDKLFLPFRSAAAIKALLEPMRSVRMRRSPLGFGLLVTSELDADLSRRWVDPCLSDAAIRRDAAAFVRGIDTAELEGVSSRLGAFDGPALLVWGLADKVFKPELGHRLRDTFRDATWVEVPEASTFVAIDAPERLATEIARAFYPALAAA